jgi:hypothetical protein
MTDYEKPGVRRTPGGGSSLWLARTVGEKGSEWQLKWQLRWIKRSL